MTVADSSIQVTKTSSASEIPSPSPRQILRLWLPSPKLGRGVGGEGKVRGFYKPDLV